MPDFTITKHTVDCYKFRAENSGYWADVTIDSTGKSGRILIASDYGNWNYYWSGGGDNFKLWIGTLNIHYVAGKFGCDNHFNDVATLKEIKEAYEELKKNNADSDLLLEFESVIECVDGCGSEKEYCNVAQSYTLFMNHFCWCPPLHTCISPQFVRFWSEVWQPLIAHLKQEVEQSQTEGGAK